jgi:hypothetical protein
MERIYLYKIVTDDGYAPCVQGGLLSLAICKPMIRSAANPGDWIIAVAANGLAASNHVVYAARVTGKLTAGAYYRDPAYASRSDRIYRWVRSELRQVPNAPVHSNEHAVAKDIGRAPEYRRAAVILSRDFRYFGAHAVVVPDPSSALGREIRRLGQGHRVNHSRQVERDLIELLNTAWAQESLEQCVETTGIVSIACDGGADRRQCAGGCDRPKPGGFPPALRGAGPAKRSC